jgi:hypothetical protein
MALSLALSGIVSARVTLDILMGSSFMRVNLDVRLLILVCSHKP